MKLHVTHIIKQFSLFVANTSDISTKRLYSSFSFSTNINPTPVLITTLTIQCAVYRLYCGPALLSVQQGQREGRQTVGHNSNSSNRHTAIYIYSDAQTVCLCCTVTVLYITIAIAAIDIENCTSTQLHKLSVSAVELLCAVQLLCAVRREVIQGVCIHYMYIILQLQFRTEAL